MYRATTPKHTFKLPMDTSLIDALIISYAQRGKVIFEKRIEDVDMEGDTITVTLTQEETNLFSKNNMAQVQLRVKVGGYVHASEIMEIKVNNVLNDEVM